MIKLLIADDHLLFLDGLRAVLEGAKDIHIIDQALNGEDVLKKLEQLYPDIDIVVLDIEMPEMTGIEVTKEIKKRYPNIKVLVVSMYNQKRYIMNLMNIGVSGYILKNKSKEVLIEAIHKIYSGQPYFGLEVLQMIASGNEEMEPESDLTVREREVLCKIAEAKTTKEIAKELHIAETTVNTHRRNLLLKLDKPNDKHLVRYAIKMGYISL